MDIEKIAEKIDALVTEGIVPGGWALILLDGVEAGTISSLEPYELRHNLAEAAIRVDAIINQQEDETTH